MSSGNEARSNLVAIVARNIPPLHGGAGHRAGRHAEQLAHAGFRVILLTDARRADPIEGVEVVRFEQMLSPSVPAVVRPILRQFERKAQIAFFRRHFRERGVDLVHAFGGHHFCLSAIRTANEFGIASMLELTLLGDDDPETMARSFRRRRSLKYYRQCDRLVALSPLLVDACRRQGFTDRQIALIPNAPRPEFQPPAPGEKERLRELLALPKEAFVVLTVGRVSPRKRTALMVECFAELAGEYQDAVFVILGPHDNATEGLETHDRISRFVATRKLDDRVQMRGYSAAVSDWMKVSDALFFASTREGFPNSFVEAMACKLPVVAFSIPGLTDFTFSERDSALIVETKQEAVAALRALHADPGKRSRLATNAYRTLEKRFSEPKIFGQYLAVYEQLAAGGEHPAEQSGPGPE